MIVPLLYPLTILSRWWRVSTAAFHRSLVPLALAAGLAACAQSSALVGKVVPAPRGESLDVLLMPPDIELSEVTAAGLLEPKAAWTRTARRNVVAALDAVVADKRARMLRYPAPSELEPYKDSHLQLVKLHGAVGQSILAHKYLPVMALPTKKDRFDWSLGRDVALLREDSEADYALFVFFRDSFSSGGRVAMIIVGALLGVTVPGGVQVGFASLVDLRSGNVVWFNRLVRQAGDLRDAQSARDATELLLSELPL